MAKKMKMSELAAPVTIYPQLLVNVRVKDKAAAQNDPDVVRAVEDASAALGDSGRILVRESGTEPLIRVMAEAETKELCEKMVGGIVDVIKAKGHEA